MSDGDPGKDGLLIDPLRDEDLEGVVALEQDQAGRPGGWTAAQFVQELRQPQGLQFVGRLSPSGQVVGGVCGRWVLAEAELLQLVVARAWRRRGFGSQLLDHFLKALAARGVERCFLEVRSANQGARRLYGACGFVEVGVRKGYYGEPADDAIVMRMDFTPVGPEEARG